MIACVAAVALGVVSYFYFKGVQAKNKEAPLSTFEKFDDEAEDQEL